MVSDNTLHAGDTSSGPAGTPSSPAATLAESELVELLLLRNRGAVDAPEMRLFDSSVVMRVFMEILRAGYLRSLDAIPAMQIYSRTFARYVFSAAGRIRFYDLERMLAASASGKQCGDSVRQS